MYNILFLLFLFANTNLSFSFENHQYNITKKLDNILCRNCGNHILNSNKIISKVSPSALKSVTDTVFNRKRVLIQLLQKDLFFRFHIITSSQSTCVGSDEWEESELWFPEYLWKPCFCSECGALIGWIFVESPKIVQPADQFFGLILDHLISENFTNSLINYPVDLI